VQYTKPEEIWLKEHPDLDERWVEKRIAEDCPGRKCTSVRKPVAQVDNAFR